MQGIISIPYGIEAAKRDLADVSYFKRYLQLFFSDALENSVSIMEV